MKKGLLVIVIFMVLITISPANAQYFKFDNNYNNAGEVEDAVNAALKMFGVMTGGGLYHTADLHSVAGFDLGLRGTIANIPEEFKGLPIFADEDYAGLAFLHGSVGLPGNFELLGRFFYFPFGASADADLNRADSRGGITLIGGGLKYGLIQAPGVPNVTLIGTYHALFVPSEFDFGTVGTLTLKAVASYSLPIFTVYVGGGFDHSRLTLNDTSPFLPNESFNTTEPQGTVGLQVRPLPFVYVNGSYSFSEFKTIEIGAGITFR